MLLRTPLNYIAITDVNRYQQFTAAPELVPSGAVFYQELIEGALGFDLVRRFRHYPSLGSIAFKDDGSEPTFVGFDHPTVMIFKKKDEATFQQDIAHLQKRLATNPNCVDSLLETATSALRAGDLDHSLQVTRQAIEQLPQSKIAYLIAADIQKQRGDREALELYRTYQEEAVRRPYPYLLFWASGKSLLELGLTDLSLSVLEEGAQRVTPDETFEMATLYIALARRLYNRQTMEDAAKIFSLSTRIHPLPAAYNFLANIALQREDYKQAVEYLEQSLQLDDKQAKEHAAVGKITARYLNNQPKALYHFQRALELDPKLEADLSGWVEIKREAVSSLHSDGKSLEQ